MVFEGKRLHDVLAVHQPTPAVPARVRFGSPMVNFILLVIELAGKF
jgi:hypothetical protein